MHLRSLSFTSALYFFHSHSFSRIPSNFITTINIRGQTDYPLEALSFAAQCLFLESLAVDDIYNEFRNGDELANCEIYTFPRLISLEIGDQIPPLFPFFVSTPQLQVLRIWGMMDEKDPLELPASRTRFETPLLRALSLENVDYSRDGSAALAYIFGLRHLQLLDLINLGTREPWLEALLMIEEGEKQAMLSIKLPRLEWIRYCVRAESFTPVYVQIERHEEFEFLVSTLMTQHPNVTLEVHYMGGSYDMLRGEPEVITGPLRFTKCSNPYSPCYTPAEEFLSIVRGNEE